MMIAKESRCNPQSLLALLNDQLHSEHVQSVTSHLDHCQECRRALDNMVAKQQWWIDTKEVLHNDTDLSIPPSHSSDLNSRADDIGIGAASWVIGLLKPSEDAESLGLLDGRQVRAVIGQGGMGVVLKVWDEQLYRPLAVKLLSPMLASTGAARQRFFREAQAAAAVVHPNIVPIYSVVKDQQLPYLVMPYIAGGNLQQRIDRDGPLPLTEILSIGVQIAEALSAAHRQGVVHRDIKPANILLDEGGHRVMLSDFGLARALDDASLTASGMIAGTPHYMSPEQARGESVDHRSDLYGLGAVLYAMATGRPPVRGDSTMAVLRRVSEETPRPVSEINESMPDWFDKLVSRLLAKRVDDRMQTAADCADMVRSCLAHVRSPKQLPLPSELNQQTGRMFATIAIAAILIGAVATVQPWRYLVGSGVATSPINPSGSTVSTPPKNSIASQNLQTSAAVLESPVESTHPANATHVQTSENVDLDQQLSVIQFELERLLQELSGGN